MFAWRNLKPAAIVKAAKAVKDVSDAPKLSSNAGSTKQQTPQKPTQTVAAS